MNHFITLCALLICYCCFYDSMTESMWYNLTTAFMVASPHRRPLLWQRRKSCRSVRRSMRGGGRGWWWWWWGGGECPALGIQYVENALNNVLHSKRIELLVRVCVCMVWEVGKYVLCNFQGLLYDVMSHVSYMSWIMSPICHESCLLYVMSHVSYMSWVMSHSL